MPTAEAAEMIDVATTRRHNCLIRCLPPTTDHRHADTGNSVVVVLEFAADTLMPVTPLETHAMV